MLGVSASESYRKWRVVMLMVVRIILDIYRLMCIPRRNYRRIQRGSLFSHSRMSRMDAGVQYDF
jgi:hypothetical protein